jgi:uncharacterized protein (UPF0332 family)
VTELPILSAAAEIAKARRFEAAARHLASGGFHEDAVSRAYYAVFHGGLALLATIGRTVRTHDGLRAVIGDHFIRPGRLPSRFARLLARAAADRNDADYNASATFTDGDSREALERTAEFLAEVQSIVDDAERPPGS